MQWIVFVDGLILLDDQHWWMVFVDGLIWVGDPHWWMVLVDGLILVVLVPVVCYKLVAIPQKHHTKFEGKQQYYMFSEKIKCNYVRRLYQDAWVS